MMAWVAANGGVRAIGESGDVTIRTVDWQDCQSSPALARPVDERVTGAVSGLALSVDDATVADVAGRRRFDLTGDRTLPAGEYLLHCRSTDGKPTGSPGSSTTTTRPGPGMQLYCRFSGPASISENGGQLSLSFTRPTPVTFGFTERTDDPASITVPPTPDGVATALSNLSAALQTTGPERSHPSMRDHPPVVDLGEEYSLPDAVEEAAPDTGIELQLPAQFAYLFVGAPLAYYLGAEVTVDDRATPRLIAPSADVDYRFRRLPTFQHGVTRLLRQVFFFDTLVRDAEAERSGQLAALANRFDLDPERIRRLSPAERLARYFWVDENDLGEYLPRWHFSTYAAPEPTNAECLPYLLDSLSLIYLPNGSKLQGAELLERSLDDFYRSSSQEAGNLGRQVDMVEPEQQAGRVHAWLSTGTPIDAFKTTPKAFENRRTYQGDRGTPLSVTVVLNDQEMSDEHDAVADIYRERSADLPLSVTVREYLTRAELAEVFTSPTDFVHYIGHCDGAGLDCPDGSFSASSLSTCETRTFFLNACGSYQEGLELVERGSVAGAVTHTKVLDEQAAKVGTAFARLLVHGFGFEPAMQLARRRVMMGKDYAVVGDGTYTLAPSANTPVLGRLERVEGGFRLSCEAVSANSTGDSFRPPFADEQYLNGTVTDAVLSRAELLESLRETPFPVIYDNEFHWSLELAETLASAWQ